MKNLREASKSFGQSIFRNTKIHTLCTSQNSYLLKVLNSSDMSNCKCYSLLIVNSHDLDNRHFDSDDFLNSVPYAEVIGSLMYAMVCSHPNIVML